MRAPPALSSPNQAAAADPFPPRVWRPRTASEVAYLAAAF